MGDPDVGTIIGAGAAVLGGITVLLAVPWRAYTWLLSRVDERIAVKLDARLTVIEAAIRAIEARHNEESDPATRSQLATLLQQLQSAVDDLQDGPDDAA